MDDLTSRFLDAFVAIERHLRRLLNADKHVSFYEMVQRAGRRDKTVRRLGDRLKDLGELRNFLSSYTSTGATSPSPFPASLRSR